MSGPANPVRGEAALTVDGAGVTIRPSFQALVAAESELGPLFEMVERAASGKLTLHEIATLFWHLAVDRDDGLTRERIGEAILEAGLAAVTPALRRVIAQILQGR